MTVVLLTACSQVPPSRVSSRPPDKVAPRWDAVIVAHGSGDGRTERFTVLREAIQWRVTASCEGAGTLAVHLDRAPAPLVVQPCPGKAFGFSIDSGRHVLTVASPGAWSVAVDQQVATPAADPPLPGMSKANELSSGSFYDIDQRGRGTATVYRLDDGRLALRFERFHVTANTDLFVWASEAVAPQTSEAAFTAPHVQIGPLRATAGDQNYLLPADLQVERFRSVIVWCEPVRTAYAAAALR